MWGTTTLRRAGAFLVVVLLAATGPSAAESSADLCNRLAAEPGTIEGVPGVEVAAIDAEAAIAACAAALEETPGDARLTHQYARALERAGRLDEAERLYEWA
ncbi:MAG TPA: tetratricopeptide repeat protein, partial [Kiloniellales bacterium]|nr:tetratricopeptide repeat protein [Kiloniellales bacterium]